MTFHDIPPRSRDRGAAGGRPPQGVEGEMMTYDHDSAPAGVVTIAPPMACRRRRNPRMMTYHDGCAVPARYGAGRRNPGMMTFGDVSPEWSGLEGTPDRTPGLRQENDDIP